MRFKFGLFLIIITTLYSCSADMNNTRQLENRIKNDSIFYSELVAYDNSMISMIDSVHKLDNELLSQNIIGKEDALSKLNNIISLLNERKEQVALMEQKIKTLEGKQPLNKNFDPEIRTLNFDIERYQKLLNKIELLNSENINLKNILYTMEIESVEKDNRLSDLELKLIQRQKELSKVESDLKLKQQMLSQSQNQTQVQREDFSLFCYTTANEIMIIADDMSNLNKAKKRKYLKIAYKLYKYAESKGQIDATNQIRKMEADKKISKLLSEPD